METVLRKISNWQNLQFYNFLSNFLSNDIFIAYINCKQTLTNFLAFDDILVV